MAQLPRREEERRLAALGIRQQAAELAAERPHPVEDNNGDEVNYPGFSYIGNYSKSLKHDAVGDPDPVSYGTLLRALQSRDPEDFKQIQLGLNANNLKLTNPQGGLAFQLVGPDTQEPTQPPAPRFDSEETAHEAGELYWMAVARDVPFANYGADPIITNAIASINGEFPAYGGPAASVQTVFRDQFAGTTIGPYVSQFLLKGTSDPRKPDGTGRDADEGYITYNAQRIDQRRLAVVPGVDYLTVFNDWLDVQNGWDRRGQDQFDGTYRFIRSLRDGANFVHFDQVIDAYYNAAWILLCEPTGNQLSGVGAGRPCVDMEFPFAVGNPYAPPAPLSPTESGFGTFGPPHVFDVLGKALGLAIRAVWWQKWGVHRRLRPEEFGGRVDNWLQGRRDYPIDPSIKDSLLTGGLSQYYGQAGERFPNSYLLPQAFPEGAPTHPSYGAGHATGSGAMATVLKAFFDETKQIENPRLAAADGLSLVAYTGADAAQMTVGTELNKLASNVSLFRNAGGVHWRSDHTQSLLLGEEIAIKLLQELSITFNEDLAFFQFTKFDGTRIRIEDGFVDFA